MGEGGSVKNGNRGAFYVLRSALLVRSCWFVVRLPSFNLHTGYVVVFWEVIGAGWLAPTTIRVVIVSGFLLLGG